MKNAGDLADFSSHLQNLMLGFLSPDEITNTALLLRQTQGNSLEDD